MVTPWRVAMAFIHISYGYQTRDITRELFGSVPGEKREIVFEMLEKGLHSPYGASMGAFFEALSAISGIGSPDSSTGSAAVSLESGALRSESEIAPKAYPYDILDNGEVLLVDPAPLIYEVVENSLAKKPPEEIAARFLQTVVDFTLEVCSHLKERAHAGKVVLTGSMFRSRYLLAKMIDGLKRENFKVLTHGVVPPDGAGIALGQAYAARARETGFTLNEP
jgi:hydrogenase maturation protein HypF